MIQFSFNRFGKLARWSLTNDKKYHWKSFLQTFVILLLVFLFFTVAKVKFNGNNAFYVACAISVIASLFVTVILGSSFMFYSMEGKHDMQALLLLPASNFEKYLMRYASWLILLPLHLVAIFAADLAQYVINMLLGHPNVAFVTMEFVKMICATWNKMPEELRNGLVTVLILVIVWMHSLYALGATFFRSHKYNWIPTTIIIILLMVLQVVINSLMGNQSLEIQTETNKFIVNVVVILLLIVFNFWMSYRLFCRQQVIGKLINL